MTTTDGQFAEQTRFSRVVDRETRRSKNRVFPGKIVRDAKLILSAGRSAIVEKIETDLRAATALSRGLS